MSFSFTIQGQTFSGRKGRKRLCPLRITVTYSGPPPTVSGGIGGSCALQVSLVGPGGVFNIEAVPPLWTAVQGQANTVQSPSFPANSSPTLIAFASYFFTADLGPPARTDSADYSIAVIDTGPQGNNARLFADTVSIAVTAEPALNKSVFFILDRCSTMNTASGRTTRFQRLQDAVTRGLGLFTDSDSVGVITLDSKLLSTTGASLRQPMTLTGAAGADALCNGLVVDTNLGKRIYQAGFDLARAQSTSASATVLLVTDGVSLTSTFPAAQQASPASVLFIDPGTTIGNTALTNLRSTDGSYAISALDTGEFVIEKLLSQILIDLGGSTIVSDPDGSLGSEEAPLSFPISLNETDRELELILFSDQAELFDIKLAGPLLKRTQDEACPPYGAQKVLVVRRSLPAITHEMPHGNLGYNVVVSRRTDLTAETQTKAKFTFLAAVQSELVLDAYASASGLEVGADLLFSVRLTEYELPVQNREDVKVHVQLSHPDGGVEEVPLHERSPGHFEASRRAFRPGVYLVHFIATGKTLLQHRPFRREALRSLHISECGSTSSCCHPSDSDC